ncbi:hypothetical protein BDZ45DRAFT_292387 [Acephala macrosclerotiorum]|nr:hypothetical protein BDZ45DRAFT_292387 [Acephala macrosclerotiorum]
MERLQIRELRVGSGEIHRRIRANFPDGISALHLARGDFNAHHEDWKGTAYTDSRGRGLKACMEELEMDLCSTLGDVPDIAHNQRSLCIDLVWASNTFVNGLKKAWSRLDGKKLVERLDIGMRNLREEIRTMDGDIHTKLNDSHRLSGPKSPYL